MPLRVTRALGFRRLDHARRVRHTELVGGDGDGVPRVVCGAQTMRGDVRTTMRLYLMGRLGVQHYSKD